MIFSRFVQTLVLTTIIASASSSVQAIETPHMVEETETAGISHRYEGGWEFYVGGGVAAFDCNGDAYPDLYFAGGSAPAGLFVNQSKLGGEIRFKPARDDTLVLDQVTGAYPMDINGDDHMDLVVLRVGENVVFKGKGNCRFERANETWAFDGGSEWSTAFSAMWQVEAAWPTMAVGNYVDRDAPGSPWGTCHANNLYSPAISGDKFQALQKLTPSYCSLSLLFSDWNRSGKPDLRVSNDRQYYKGGQEQLWKINEVGEPSLYTKQDGWKALKIWGMGIASHDVTGDGRPEYYLTSMGDNKLRTHSGSAKRPSYKDMARKMGITAHRPFIGNSTLPSTGWHAQFEDMNNDGFTDLFVTKGNVHAMSDFASEDPNNLMLGRPNGSFKEVAKEANFLSFKKARGGALVDLNLDGLLDVAVVNREENIQLWRNAGLGSSAASVPMGNWISLKLEQQGGNRQAVGAWIEVRSGEHVQRKEITIGGGHASGVALWHHFGVGVAERATVRVQWPGGEWGPWVRLFANQFARITRGKSVADIWLPSKQARSLH